MNRQVLHYDLDTFFVSVERLHNRRLIGKPVIVGGLSDRGVVASCSYEARGFGVRSAMPIRLAKQLCPHGLYISGDYESYSKFSDIVTQIIREDAPVYEKASIDEFYLDVTGMDKFFGCLQWSEELKARIVKETKLPISFALASNKMLSKVATTDAKPNGEFIVPEGQEQAYLDPKSILRIPMVGEKTFRVLSEMGAQIIAKLRMIPPEMLQRLLGKNGIELWRRANAIDETPVIPYSEAKSLSSEQTFEIDSTDVATMKKLIHLLTDNLSYDLRKSNMLTGCITIKIRYSDFNTLSKQTQVPYTSSSAILIAKALHLFEALYDRRLLVRLIGVRFSKLVQGNYQINAFDDTLQDIHLSQAVDYLKGKYGKGAITAASLLNLKTL